MGCDVLAIPASHVLVTTTSLTVSAYNSGVVGALPAVVIDPPEIGPVMSSELGLPGNGITV
jgi:hypothetical protein